MKFRVGVSKPWLFVDPCLFIAIKLYWNFKPYCFYFFPKSALLNWGCGLSTDAAYTWTFTVGVLLLLAPAELIKGAFSSSGKCRNTAGDLPEIWREPCLTESTALVKIILRKWLLHKIIITQWVHKYCTLIINSHKLRTFVPKSSHVQIFLKLWLQVENDKIRLKT